MNTLLNFLISSGMLSLSDTDMVIFMTERKKYLAEHPYKIYQGKDNCWHTFSRGGNSGNVSDPTADTSLRIEIFSRHMKMVEQTAIETDPELYSYILRCVTEGCSYVALRTYYGIPCGRDYFYERYRKFFWLLDKDRG